MYRGLGSSLVSTKTPLTGKLKRLTQLVGPQTSTTNSLQELWLCCSNLTLKSITWNFICTQSAAFPFYLTRFYYKISVHREKESDNYYPSELISDIHQHFVLCSHNFIISSLLTALCSFAARFTTHVVSHLAACTLSSYHIEFFIEFFYIFHSLDSYFLL